MPKLRKIDSLTIGEHYYLEATDACYYFGEYTAGEGPRYSETNQLIWNFKKKPERKAFPDYQYKLLAIQQAGQWLAGAFKPAALPTVTFVGAPPSRCIGDPGYDDRIEQALQVVAAAGGDVRQLISQAHSRLPAHESQNRPKPEDLARNYRINPALGNPVPTTIVVVDDMLTTGCTFKAMSQLLRKSYPNAKIAGIFLARRALPSTDEFDTED
ncbi:putative amidophosphoribosyltransferase [Cupriavidus metallidurans]|jgi:predicted amidophosphoribosyltransferase|uniref:hypothetical protein n=1 Tax=Cupriavidus TaxID=106589 RepID=UPI000791ED8D|nr:hypothetical protein [Cupriavidus metallidurans]KWW37906.1 hypothetical protein AU374_01685 [Cupriavidus metallidurans]MDE4918140.1 hypothetical protein [Cupriavidus metallidurans]